jgi:enoyl-CoA hydratase/carnithine racemase
VEYIDLRYEKDGSIVTITLDRPESRNAYSEGMLDSFERAFDEADVDPEVRAVILTGAGATFSAGGDVKRMRERSGMFAGGPIELRSRYLAGIHRVPRRLARFEKPLLAAINGPAIGAGLDLACMCDLRIAAQGARLGSTFVKLGLIPGDGGAYVVARVVGFPRALELMLTGRLVDAQEAERIGLVNAVVSRERLLEAVREKALEIAENAPLAVRLTKAACYQSWNLGLDAALNLAATYQGMVQNTPDHDEGVTAMVEQRKPEFRG